MSQAPPRRHLLGVNLFGLLLLLVVGASGQGALYWMEAFDADGQALRQALQHQQRARQALDGLRTGIEQALLPQANVEQEALTQDEASLFLDAHATELGAALTALEALPLNERSRSALQAMKPTLKGRLADIQGVALIGLKTGSINYLPAIRRALDRLTHELDQFQALLLTELQAGQQAATSARQQAQVALAALLALCALMLLAMGGWQRRKLQGLERDLPREDAAPLQTQAQAPSPAADKPRPAAAERADDPQQHETLTMLRQLSQSTDQLTRLVSQIKTPNPAASAAAAPAQPAPAQIARPPSADKPTRGAPVPHPMADLAGAIDDIAFQSSMLAMNAEAARHGEPGQGYAQLVEEVRLLASRSAQTAKTFKSRIQPQPVTEPVIEAVKPPAIEPDDDDDEGGVVVQIRQAPEAPAPTPVPAPAPAVALKRKDKVVALEPHLMARQDETAPKEPQTAKAKPSATVLQTGRLLRTRG